MKTSKIIFFIALLALMTTLSFAKNLDKTTEDHQRIAKRFVEILNEQWGIDKEKISGESYFLRDFGADKLDIIELIMALEEDFDIVIPDDEWARVTTVNSAVELIIKRIDSRHRLY
jgi:acyl carrier protein